MSRVNAKELYEDQLVITHADKVQIKWWLMPQWAAPQLTVNAFSPAVCGWLLYARTRLCWLECKSMSGHNSSPLPINPANKQNKHSSCYTPHSPLHTSQHRLSLAQDHFHIVCTTWTRLVISILGLYCHGEDYGVRLDWHVNTGTGLVDTINMSCQQNIYTLSI